MESSITILSLPKEVYKIITSHIDFVDVLDLCVVNKYFYDILKDKYQLKILSDKIRSSYDIFKKMKIFKHGFHIHIAAIALSNNMIELFNSIRSRHPRMEYAVKMHIVYMNRIRPEYNYRKIKGLNYYNYMMISTDLKIQDRSGKTYYEYLDSLMNREKILF